MSKKKPASFFKKARHAMLGALFGAAAGCAPEPQASPVQSEVSQSKDATDRLIEQIQAQKTPFDAEAEKLEQLWKKYGIAMDKVFPRNIRSAGFLALDPVEYATAQAFNIKPQEYLKKTLINKGNFRSIYLENGDASRWISEVAPTPWGNATLATQPTRFFVYTEKGSEICTIIPQSLVPIEKSYIPGLSPAQMRTYVNYHETFHCLDERSSGHASEDIALEQRLEIFADVAALGQMVADGADPVIIDHVFAWRKSTKVGAKHITETGLALLRDKIEEMGLDAYRQLTAVEKLPIFYKIVEESAMSPIVFTLTESFLEPQTTVTTHPETSLSSINEAFSLAERIEIPPHPLAGLTYQLSKMVGGWHPKIEIETRAIAASGKITPSSLIAAHAAFYRDMVTQEEQQPTNPVPALKMERMLMYFSNLGPYYDYEAINVRLGGIELNADDLAEIAAVKELYGEPQAVSAAPHLRP